MKTMNYLFTVVFAILLSACSNESQTTEEELSSVDFKGRWSQEKEENQEKEEETQEVYELDLRQYFVVEQLIQLNSQKIDLEERIDGGEEQLIPHLEGVMKNLDIFNEQFIHIRELICVTLRLKAERLKLLAENGDSQADSELQMMDESLKNCGIEITYFVPDLGKLAIISLGKTKTVGGCKNPGPIQACGMPIPEGEKIILVNEKLNYFNILTKDGRPLAKAQLMGVSEKMEGFYEYLIDVPSSVNSEMTIAVSIGNLEYEAPIRPAEGY